SQAHHPLFQVMLTFQNLGQGTIELPELDVSGYEIDTGNAKFDLQMTLWEPSAGQGRHEGLSARFTYATDLFDESTVAAFARRFVRLLEAVVAVPDSAVGDVDLLDADERVRLVGEWTAAPAVAAAPDVTLVDLFEGSVCRSPEAVAVRSGDETLTYAELAARVHRLARHLISCGVGPESLVAVALPRSADLVVALLAVLEAGGGYLPVDPTYPADRIEYMLADARPVCAVSWSGRPVSFPDGLTVVDVDTTDLSSHADTAPSDGDRRAVLRPGNTAYVIYTSGSTGRPKGVAVPHTGVTRLLSNTESLYGFDDSDVWTLFHSYAFDFSVWELWGPLAYGGTLVVVDYLTSRSPDAFRALVAAERVTVLNQTPSAFYQFAEADRVADANIGRLSLRWVIFGGEALEPRRLAPWFVRHDDRAPRLVNMYGITETTVHVSFREIPASWAATSAPSVIGRALPGLRAYVLDRRLRPVPVGVAGEMYVAGGQITRGYLGRPDLTAARFVADPFVGDGTVLYRTGDVARWTPEGELEYVGRADDQVKVRGFRIELGEIEAAVLEHPGVGQAAVVVREDIPGDQRLVAYVVPVFGSTVDADDVTAFAARSLPDYMVPAHVVALDAIPLTVNGKLDRRALPAPEARTREFRAPRTGVEQAVAEVFAEVLGLDRVGLDDDFFDLGGNSLVATRVAARLDQALDTPVAVRALFETSRVETLAARLEPLAGSGSRPALTPQERGTRIPLSLAQRRMWLLNQMDTAGADYNIPLVLRLSGPIDVTALTAAMHDVVARHETLRTVYPSDADGPYQRIVAPEQVPAPALEAIDEARLPARVAELVGRGFDVETEVPVRSALLRSADDEHVLVLVVHHISADGESMAPLARDTMLAYAARLGGGAPAWSPLPVQYADYAIWQHRVIGEPGEESVAGTQIAYWRQALASVPHRALLPTDRPRPAAPTGRGAAISFTLDPVRHESLRRLARDHRASEFMVAHAVLALLVARLGGAPDVVIGTPVAGRGDRALDDLIGMFVNTVALPVTVDPDAGFAELVRRVRDADLSAFAHADVPFEEVVDALGTRGPLFDVALSMEPAAGAELTLPELTVSALDSVVPAAKFDLQLTLDTGARGELTGTWLYATDLFDAATVEALGARFTGLLDQVTADPNVPVGELDLMTEAERDLGLGGAAPGDTEPVGPDVRSAAGLDRRLAAVVEDDPDAPAVVTDGTETTYRAIDERSSRLARLLLADGYGPGDRIGVRVEPTVDTVVALWAVVKAGAAVVALGPDDTVIDAPPVCVIGSRSQDGVPLIDPGMDDVEARLVALSPRPLGHADRVRPSHDADPAFSGAVGPLLDRGAFAAALDALCDELDVDYESRLSVTVPAAAEIARWTLLAASAGAAIVFGDTDADSLVELLADEWITHALVPDEAAGTVRDSDLPDLVTVVTVADLAGR
ncbi:amino acid adenylation domain-containing protein, partial [Rhodococcus sp. SJ]|uniref:amino acid adenylation domain-containing protein n=1 Tax=Rhodococcus sp. SJ TaxID=3434112 RepID=UPI003D7B1DF9